MAPRLPVLSRRTLLGAIGAGAALAPFLPLLNSSAQTAAPKRLILWWTPHGTVREKWLPTGSGSAFELSTILAPLEAYKRKLLVLDGLQMDGGTATGHSVFPALWTASPGDDAGCSDFGWGPSVDQVVASAIGMSSPYKSLELGFQAFSGSNCVGTRMIYAGANQPIAPSEDPWDVWNRLFGRPLDPSALDRLRAERKSTLDVLRAELNGMRALAPAADKPKIDAHLDGLRSIESRLALTAAACVAPDVGTKQGDIYSTERMPQILDLEADIITAAMACDLTRVASVQVTKGDNDGSVYSFLDPAMTAGHHEISHLGDSDLTARDQLTTIYTFYAQRFAYLLGRLDSVVEANGKTMLDNSLVVWGSEVAKGNTHATTPMPFVLAGSAGGAIDTGRFLTVPDGTWHNRLLVTICQAMGLDNVNTFGTSDTGKGSGPLGGVLV